MLLSRGEIVVIVACFFSLIAYIGYLGRLFLQLDKIERRTYRDLQSTRVALADAQRRNDALLLQLTTANEKSTID